MNRFDINSFYKKINKKYFGRNMLLFLLGTLTAAISFNLFYNSYDVVPTGSSGFSLLVNNYFEIDISLMILIVNIVLLLMGLIFFGKKYALKMLFITIIYPIFIKTTFLITQYINFGQVSLLLMMVFGGVTLGLSSGLIKKSTYSPGGFSVIYDLMYKYFHISYGKSSLIVNLIMISWCSIVFGLNSALYALISLIISSYIVDKVIIGISNNKVFYIITNKPLEIRDYIIDKLHYSVTIVNARGGYNNKKRKMIMCVVPTIEYVKLKELISEIDSEAFFLIVDTYESSIKKNCKNM